MSNLFHRSGLLRPQLPSTGPSGDPTGAAAQPEGQVPGVAVALPTLGEPQDAVPVRLQPVMHTPLPPTPAQGGVGLAVPPVLQPLVPGARFPNVRIVVRARPNTETRRQDTGHPHLFMPGTVLPHANLTIRAREDRSEKRLADPPPIDARPSKLPHPVQHAAARPMAIASLLNEPAAPLPLSPFSYETVDLPALPQRPEAAPLDRLLAEVDEVVGRLQDAQDEAAADELIHRLKLLFPEVAERQIEQGDTAGPPALAARLNAAIGRALGCHAAQVNPFGLLDLAPTALLLDLRLRCGMAGLPQREGGELRPTDLPPT